jgi:mxaJ protein
MSSGSRLRLPALALAAVAGLVCASSERAGNRQDGPSGSALRVCADPNDLPYSNVRGEGFENALARLIAADLGRSVQYTWWPQRRGFIRNTLQAGRCDVVMGMTASSRTPPSPGAAAHGVQTTLPYYRSAYVFVFRHDVLASRHERGGSMEQVDDAHLKRLRIGVHVVGAGNGVPPAQALAQRGLLGNVRGYSIYGDYSKPHPASALIEGVARGDIDLAVAWGPLAGYFARRQPVPLEIAPVPARFDTARTPMAFDIAIGVRGDEIRLRIALDEVLERRRDAVEQLLLRYGVPLVGRSGPIPVAHPVE